MDEPTIRAYDDARNRSAYLDLKGQHKAHPALKFFISRVPQDGLVLDLGCGVGAEAAIMVEQGLRVDAVDASQGMVDCARDVNGIDARLATFDDIKNLSDLDGVWAHFSLLHVARDKLPEYLNSISAVLKPDGVFYLCMKLGVGDHRDGLGRLYTYYEEQELDKLMRAAGFDVFFSDTGNGVGLDEEVIHWMMLFGAKPSDG
jgi:SAM-dependent methyltransferase